MAAIKKLKIETILEGDEELTIAIEGCCHGQLDAIYAAIREAEQRGSGGSNNNNQRKQKKVDLLLVCGDFQCVRDWDDLNCVAMPPKFRELNTFHQYVTGEKVAPVLTIFIGGNHEASNILQSMFYGGFVAPNIFFLGFAGVVRFGGLRIGGLSGIFNDRHYRMGHYERPPYSPDTVRSVYHVREFEVWQMAHLVPRSTRTFASRHMARAKAKAKAEAKADTGNTGKCVLSDAGSKDEDGHVDGDHTTQSKPSLSSSSSSSSSLPCSSSSSSNSSSSSDVAVDDTGAPRGGVLDMFLSHDWPKGVWSFGDCRRLLQKKAFLKDDMDSGKLGNYLLLYLYICMYLFLGLGGEVRSDWIR